MEHLTNCRLCNYQSDKRLMLNIFDEPTAYSEKIENYLNLNLKVYDVERSPPCICFHCSQTIDNFHNFATKIKQIQKILFPEQQEEIQYEICVIQPADNSEVLQISEGTTGVAEAEEAKKGETFQYSIVRTRSQKALKESTLWKEILKKETARESTINENLDEEQSSNRSFDFDDNTDLFDDATLSGDEIPTRDSENNDWPSAEALKKIPTKLIASDGLLLYKGKRLMRLMSIFYNTSCESCSQKFKGLPELFEHQKSQHKIEPYVSCCSSQLSKLPRVIWHFVKHIQPEAFKCQICSYVVSRPKFLELHLQTHSHPAEKPFSCDKCDKRFIWKGALKSHLINHQPESERKLHLCPICNRNYQTAGSLSSHRKSAHDDKSTKTRNLCEICSKSFSTLTSYKEHMITHSADSEKLQLKCTVCDKWLKNQRCLKSHMQLHANIDFVCSICEYITKKEKLLKNHIITKHSSERPFSCEDCGKTFKVKRALTIHKAQNHSETSKTGKTCEFCNRNFASSTNYYTHRKNLHSVELQQILDQKREEEKLKRIKIGLENPTLAT